MTLTGKEIWRDYETDGVPGSGVHSPAKSDLRIWSAWLETVQGGGGPGLGYATEAALEGDLTPAAKVLAIVYDDASPGNNGMYVKSGASGSGSWSRIGDLPNGIIRLTVTGGTANAIIATAPETPSIPGNKLYLLIPTAQNTDTTTIAVNGASAAPIKNAFGSDLASGSLLANSQVLMARSGDNYQLLISANVDASAILADAQAADVSATAQASAAAGSASDAAATASTVSGTVGGIIAQTRVDAAAATIPTSVNVVLVEGIADAGDAPLAPYVSRLSEPSHAGKFLSNGIWRELERRDGVYLEDFGGKQSILGDFSLDLSLDNATAFQDCIDYCVAKHRAIIRINSGVWRFASGGFTIPVGINLRGHGHSSSGYHGGSQILLDYDGGSGGAPEFCWDGSGTEFNGTGGGIHQLSILRQDGKHGGTLLKVKCTDTTHRPGYMSFRDLRLGATGTGSVDYCLQHDGSAVPVSGTQGLRDVLWEGIWMDGADVEMAQFLNATHAKLSGVQCSQGTGAVAPIMRITGASNASLDKTTDLQASNLSVTGNLILQNADHCVIHGAASILTLDVTNVTASMLMGTWDVIKNTSGTTLSTSDIDNLRSSNGTIILGHGTSF